MADPVSLRGVPVEVNVITRPKPSVIVLIVGEDEL